MATIHRKSFATKKPTMTGFEMILPFLNPIEHLILDDTVSEVMLNSPDPVFIEKEQSGAGESWGVPRPARTANFRFHRS